MALLSCRRELQAVVGKLPLQPTPSSDSLLAFLPCAMAFHHAKDEDEMVPAAQSLSWKVMIIPFARYFVSRETIVLYQMQLHRVILRV